MVEYSADHAEVQRGIAQRQIQIDQQRALRRLLGHRYRKIAGQRRHSIAALGAEKHQQPPPAFFGDGGRTASRGPNQRLGHRALRKRARVRNSRAPARMQRTSSSESAFTE
jgi:hypothetical protein